MRDKGQSAGGSQVVTGSGPLLGCIADDYTGATDVAAGLRSAGMHTILLFGLPAPQLQLPDCDAIVVALKTRSVAPADAVKASLDVQSWLAAQGVGQLYFKYCSTFDSTDLGNIGPVADALMAATSAQLTVVCPSSPQQSRTVYQGHLFVGNELLSESPMRHHSLNPMTDSSLLRLLGKQTSHDIGLVDLRVVRSGAAAVTRAFEHMASQGVRYAIVDALEDDDLHTVAEAVAGMSVATGAAGLAGAIGAALMGDRPRPTQLGAGPLPEGRALILAGSCSVATREQVAFAQGRYAWHRLDPLTHPSAQALTAAALDWVEQHIDAGEPLLVFSSATPEEQRAVKAAAIDGVAEMLEETLSAVALFAVERGCRRVIVAGGETSGAVVEKLGVRTVVVGSEQAPGVPWLITPDDPSLALLLKSGNYGGRDLMVEATEAQNS